MLALLFALGLVAGVVGLAKGQADDPSIRRFLEEHRLRHVASKRDGALTLPEAEDGLFLARRYGDRALTRRFENVVTSLKGRRS